jgi:hypothetical protein
MYAKWAQSKCNGGLVPVGDDSVQPFNLREAITSEPVKTASAIALTYHGYRRTGSIVWALVYGLMGRWIPVVSVPIALAQGYGEKKPCP